MMDDNSQQTHVHGMCPIYLADVTSVLFSIIHFHKNIRACKVGWVRWGEPENYVSAARINFDLVGLGFEDSL